MTAAVIGLGANLADPERALHRAAAEIAALPGVVITHRSRLYRTAPVGGPQQPDYVNAVVVVDATCSPWELLSALRAIEDASGRVRTVRWGPRTLDLDLISVAGVESVDPLLELPHPRAWERAFVLVPWLDADPEAALPPYGAVADRVSTLDTSGCVALPGPRVGAG